MTPEPRRHEAELGVGGDGPLVILIGLMGAGKTGVGRELARRLRVPFTDLDERIEAQQGRSISEIFAADGEQEFRRIEADALAAALVDCPGVLSLGGGAPMHPVSQSLLRGRNVVLLEIAEDEAERRLSRSTHRPLLQDPDPMGRWRELAAQRLPVYRDLARWSQTGDRRPPTAVAREIHELLRAARTEETA